MTTLVLVLSALIVWIFLMVIVVLFLKGASMYEDEQSEKEAKEKPLIFTEYE